MFQNHLMQLLALISMEPPSRFEAAQVQDEKVKVFRALKPLSSGSLADNLMLGQYGPGSIDGRAVAGYRQEPGVDPDSNTPTFAAMKVEIDNWRWRDVPFYLVSGKRMAAKETRIIIQFKEVPHVMFRPETAAGLRANRLILGVFPEEKIGLKIQVKAPGAKECLHPATMSFNYERRREDGGHFGAYEMVLLDCIIITTLLAIDDDPDILMVLKANLELHEFTLLTAESLAAAREILAARTPALILLDLMLPDGNGLDFCGFIKEHYPHLPIIMISAKDQVADRVVGLELGADDYLIKPFATAELLARIRARLRPPALPPSESLTFDGLYIDLQNQRIKVGDQEVSLTPKQFQLLVLLATNPDRLVTRDEIQQSIWRNPKLYAWSRVIDVHIQHLRRKIEPNPSEPRYIITVVGPWLSF